MRGRHLEAGHLCVDFEILMSRERLELADSMFYLVKAAHLLREADGQHLGPFTLPRKLRLARFVKVAV